MRQDQRNGEVGGQEGDRFHSSDSLLEKIPPNLLGHVTIPLNAAALRPLVQLEIGAIHQFRGSAVWTQPDAGSATGSSPADQPTTATFVQMKARLDELLISS